MVTNAMTTDEHQELELLLTRATGICCLLTYKQKQRMRELINKSKEITNDNETITRQG